MRRTLFRLTLLCAACLILLTGSPYPTAAQETPPVTFWSDHGPVAVRRTLPPTSRDLLTALLAGPTSDEQAQGIWSAIPSGTTLERLAIAPGLSVTVRLALPPDTLTDLTHDRFEIIVRQIGATLDPLAWRELHIETWDPTTERFVPLADFLPPIPPPRKETLPAGADEATTITPTDTGQPPASGQGQPQGALSGKTVYVSAGHGWEWVCDVWDEENEVCARGRWRVQRIPYPRPPYVGPIIEDFNNAEVVNQYLLQYLWNAGARVIPVRERDMNPVVRIANNDDATGYAEQGAWETSTFAGYNLDVPNQTYRYTTTVAGTATATATWTTAMPDDGRYAVYVWYRHGPNRPGDARYTVHHAGGQTTVAVDQRHHGNTWHYIGTYGFQAGQPARVTLTNESSVAGQAVVADAIRIGGGTFDSLAGIETTALYPPGEPWWDVAAYYYTQRMGMDAAPGDVTARPIYARWEHAGSGEDAVYVSWHTNGYSGYQETYTGTMSIIHNGVGNPVTPGSEQLRSAIHNELLNDIRAAWDPNWPGWLRQMNLGELRELWDPDPDVALPGALIEIAYHDSPNNTDALKEPTFGILTARAVYQGILKYFDPHAVQLPEPPTHLAARNLGGGRVQLDWRPPLTDTEDVVGDAATGYRVYTSPNGLGWSNAVPVDEASHTLTGLTPGQLLFVRVTATNAGGESFPTETLAVRVGDPADVLIVNGFDRLNRTMSIPDLYEPNGETHLRMLLDQMNRYDYVVQHGQVISYTFDSASNEAVAAGDVSLADYGLVDWILGEESIDDETLDATEQSLLTGFLSGGGSLLISGSEIGWDLDAQGSAGDQAFYGDTLRAAYAGDDAGTYEVAPAPGSIFDGLSAFRFDDPTGYDADYPDQLLPANGSVAALVYQGGAGGTAALQYQDGCQRLVYLGFPFETIRAAHRPAVMARALDFLDECTVQPPQTAITSPIDGSFHQLPPSFAGTAAGKSGVTGVEVTICRQADNHCWDGSAWMTPTVWLSATGTTTWHYALPDPLTDGIFTLQARARDGEGRPDPTPAATSFRLFTVDHWAFLPLVWTTPEPACHDLVADGGFESDGSWTMYTRAIYTTTQVHSGARSAFVGIPPGEPGAFVYSSVTQEIDLPAGNVATLSLWLYPIAENEDPDDRHTILLIDEVGAYHFLDTAVADTRAWEERTYDLSPYLGQKVVLYVGTTNDGDDDTTALYIDDVSLEVCQ